MAVAFDASVRPRAALAHVSAVPCLRGGGAGIVAVALRTPARRRRAEGLQGRRAALA